MCDLSISTMYSTYSISMIYIIYSYYDIHWIYGIYACITIFDMYPYVIFHIFRTLHIFHMFHIFHIFYVFYVYIYIFHGYALSIWITELLASPTPGHRAVIEASYAFGRFHTAEMTAAGALEIFEPVRRSNDWDIGRKRFKIFLWDGQSPFSLCCSNTNGIMVY